MSDARSVARGKPSAKQTRANSFALALALGGLALLAPGSARGAPTPHAGEAARQARARELYGQGTVAFNLGDFDQAIADYKQAYELSAAPGLLFNLAQSYRLKGDPARALYFYRTYLRLEPRAPNRVDVEALITTLEDELAHGARPASAPSLHPPLGAASGAQAASPSTAPAAPAGTSPATSSLRPGILSPAAPIPPASFASRAALAAAASQALGTSAPRTTSRDVTSLDRGSDQAAVRHAARERLVGLTSASAGVALIVTGVAFGLAASSDAGDLSLVGQTGGIWTARDASVYAAGQRDQRVEEVLLPLGGVAVVAGGILYYLGWRAGKAAEVTGSAHLSVDAAAGGARAELTCRF